MLCIWLAMRYESICTQVDIRVRYHPFMNWGFVGKNARLAKREGPNDSYLTFLVGGAIKTASALASALSKKLCYSPDDGIGRGEGLAGVLDLENDFARGATVGYFREQYRGFGDE